MFNLKKVLLCFCLSFLFVVGVKAEMLSDIEFKIVNNSSGGSYLYDLLFYTDRVYSVYYSSTDVVPDFIDFGTYYDDFLFDGSTYGSVSDNGFEYMISFHYTDNASKFGDLYATLYDVSDSHYVRVSDPIFIKRPEYFPYGSRMDVHLDSEFEDITLLIHDMYNFNSNINIKVGEVTDSSILRDFSLTHNYTNLLNFAKNDNNFLKYISGNAHNFQGTYDSTGIIDGKYYYIYLSIDTENGKYYPLDEIVLCKSKNGDLSSDFEFEYKDVNYDDIDISSGDNSIVDDSSLVIISDNKTSGITENPKTGVYSVGILSIMVLFVGLLFVRKFNLFKKI